MRNPNQIRNKMGRNMEFQVTGTLEGHLAARLGPEEFH